MIFYLHLSKQFLNTVYFQLSMYIKTLSLCSRLKYLLIQSAPLEFAGENQGETVMLINICSVGTIRTSGMLAVSKLMQLFFLVRDFDFLLFIIRATSSKCCHESVVFEFDQSVSSLITGILVQFIVRSIL